MKKIGSVVLHGLLSAGMIYGLISIFPLPASACTPTQCAALQQNVSTICAQVYHCYDGGVVESCNSSGAVILCLGSGSQCGVYPGSCQ